MTLGAYVTFVNSTRFNGAGLNKRCTIVVGRDAVLSIGDHSGFSGVSLFCAERISIGSHVMVGGNVCIWDSDFHSLNFEDRKTEIDEGVFLGVHHRPIAILDGAFIGANSLILKGVTIGRQSIVGAGSVVTRDIPEKEVWAGNPARFVRRAP